MAGEERAIGSFILICLFFQKELHRLDPSKLPAQQLHLSTPVHAVFSGEGKALLVTAAGMCETFDHIIFARHSGDALRIVDAGGGTKPEEREILSTFQ